MMGGGMYFLHINAGSNKSHVDQTVLLTNKEKNDRKRNVSIGGM